jgi:hypothetical protein
MRLRPILAKAMVAGALGLPAVGLGIGLANHPPSPPQVPTLPNVPAVASPVLATAMANADEATANGNEAAAIANANEAAAMANANQLVSAITATPLGGERARSSGVAGLNPHGWAGVTSIPLLGPSGGLLG